MSWLSTISRNSGVSLSYSTEYIYYLRPSWLLRRFLSIRLSFSGRLLILKIRAHCTLGWRGLFMLLVLLQLIHIPGIAPDILDSTGVEGLDSCSNYYSWVKPLGHGEHSSTLIITMELAENRPLCLENINFISNPCLQGIVKVRGNFITVPPVWTTEF